MGSIVHDGKAGGVILDQRLKGNEEVEPLPSFSKWTVAVEGLSINALGSANSPQ